MSLTQVQFTKFVGTANTSSHALTVTSTGAGNLLVLIIGWGTSGSGLSISTPAGWTVGEASFQISTVIAGAGFYQPNNAGGITSITVSTSGGTATQPIFYFWEYSGALTASPLDQHNHVVANTSTTLDTGALNTTQADAIALAGWFYNSGSTGFSSGPTNSYSQDSGEDATTPGSPTTRGRAAHKLEVATENAQATLTLTGAKTGFGLGMVFKAAAAGTAASSGFFAGDRVPRFIEQRGPGRVPLVSGTAAPEAPLLPPFPYRIRRASIWIRSVRGSAVQPQTAVLVQAEVPRQASQRQRRLYLSRRGRHWAPTWFQAPLPPVVGELWRHRRQFAAWLTGRRLTASDQVSQPPVEMPPASTRVHTRWSAVRKARASVPIQANEIPQPTQRPRLRLWLRRQRQTHLPFPQVAVLNPPFVEFFRRRVLQRFWTRPSKGKVSEPPWGQAAAAPNPPFVELFRRRVLQHFWVRPPKGRMSEPPWGQAAPNTNQPYYVTTLRLRRLWGHLRRSRQPILTPDVMLALQPGRKRRWGLTKRSRATVVSPGQPGVPTQPPRSRRAVVWPRRVRILLPPMPAVVVIAPVFVDWVRRRVVARIWPRQPRGRRFEPGWGQAISSIPVQPIAITVITRSMSALVATRAMTATVITRSLIVLVRTRDLVVGIITRSGSSRPNTRG